MGLQGILFYFIAAFILFYFILHVRPALLMSIPIVKRFCPRS